MFSGVEPLLNTVERCRFLGILCWLLFYCSSLQAANYGFTLDFEEGNLRGWTISGQAFRSQPTLGDNPAARGRGQPSRHEGRYWVGTYENYQGKRGQKAGDIQGDRPLGALTSKRFTIPEGSLSFLVGGGSDAQHLGVELWVKTRQTQEFDCDRVYRAAGQNSESMRRVTWDLTPYAGKTGFIHIVDNASSGWGHINVDDFRFTPKSGHPEMVGPALDSGDIRPAVEPVRVPSLVNHPLEKAKELLKATRLNLGRVEKHPSPSQPGIVLEQTPRAGALLPSRGAVDVAVATPGYLSMPKLVGKDIAIALEIIKDKELRQGVVRRIPSTEKTGIVLQQNPPAGNKVVANTEVSLAIAQPERVRVPDLIGKEPQEAEKLLGATHLLLGDVKIHQAPRTTATVISQDPAPGTTLLAGSQVNFVIASPQMITVPNLIGLDLSKAKEILDRSGLRQGEVQKRTVARPPGTVLEQEPSAGVKVSYNSPVRVTVAEGLPPAIMPDLIGMSLNNALATLQQLNLPAGDISSKGSDRPVDTVLEQKPAPGSAVEVGTSVSLCVARERKNTAILWGIMGLALAALGVAGGLWLRTAKKRSLPKPGTDFSITCHAGPGHRTLLAEKPLFREGELRIRSVKDRGRHSLTCKAEELFQKTKKG